MKRIVPVIIIFVMQVFFTACNSRSLQNQYSVLERQTVFVENSTVVKAARCAQLGVEDTPDCKILLESLPDIYSRSTGSGTFINRKGKITVLTVEHVCSGSDVPNLIERGEFMVEVKQEIKLKIASGNFVSFGKVIKADKEKDLCLIELDEQPNNARVAHVSLYPARKGSKVYYAGAPYGMMSNEFMMYFEGNYSGPHEGSDIFSLPCAPGASGSSIRNEHGMIVSIVQKVHSKFNHVCFGASTQSIRDFLSN
jgi:hypothetical protein